MYLLYFYHFYSMIYTTNSIENLNRQIRKVTKHKVSFDQASNLLDLVFMVIKDHEVNNWQNIQLLTSNIGLKYTI